MQISSNLTGVNFKSVYQSVVLRRDQPAPEKAPSYAVAEEARAQDDNLAQTEATHRQTQLLQAAQRSAQRTADLMDQASDL